MKKVLLLCVALAAGTAMSMAQDLPVFPDSFDVTADSGNINIWQGSTENIAESGVEVSEDEIDFAITFQAEHAIVLSGTTDLENVTLSFALPQGWAGVAPVKINMQPMGSDSMLKTRANDFEPAPLQEFLESLSGMGWFNTTEVAYGNPVVFPVNEGKQLYLGFLYLTDDGTLTGDPAFAGDYVDSANSVLIVVDVENGGTVADEPVFPETIEYTINGEKELAGVDVNIKNSNYGPTMYVTGESDAETVTISLAVPDGWDGWIISSPFAEVSEQSLPTTRGADDWVSVDFMCQYMGYQKGNTVTFAVEEEENSAFAGLYKGDLVYGVQNLTIEYNVVPSSSTGGDDPVVSDGPVMPESIQVTTFAEGLIVDQEKDEEDGSIYIDVTGTIEEAKYDLVLDVPEGWDGFVIDTFADDDVTVGEYGVDPKKASSVKHDWQPLENYLENGCIIGNKITIKANGNYTFVYAYLYKGELVDENAIALIVSKVANIYTENNYEEYVKVVDAIDSLKAQYNSAVAEAKEQYPDFDFSEWEEIINDMISQSYSGANQAYDAANDNAEAFFFPFDGEEIEAAIYEMKVAPIMEQNYAAYDLVMTEINAAQAEYENAVAYIENYYPEADVTEMKGIIENAIAEAAEGAEQALYAAHDDGEAFFYPFSNEEIMGMIEQMVVDAKTSGVGSVNAADKASYYDLNGNKISTPKAGMYIKVVDGKATKVVVK